MSRGGLTARRRTIGSLTHADFGSHIEVPGVVRGVLWAVQHIGVMGDHREALTRITVRRHGASEATRGLPADTAVTISKPESEG